MCLFRNGSNSLFTFIDKMAPIKQGLSLTAGTNGASGKNSTKVTNANMYKVGIRAGFNQIIKLHKLKLNPQSKNCIQSANQSYLK